MYNAVSVALVSRIYSSRVKDVRSSIYYHVSDWNSDYVINQNVLLEEEKEKEYSLLKNFNSSLIYAKKILKSDPTLLDYYKRSVYDYLADQYSIPLQEIDASNVTMFIEITNPDVKILNAVKTNNTNDTIYPMSVPSWAYFNIPTSYCLYALTEQATRNSLFAYTDAPSAQFKIPGGFGAYVMRQREYSSSSSTIDSLSSKISARNIYQSYPFNFTIFNSYVFSKESSDSFNANWSAEIEATYQATLYRQEYWYKAAEALRDANGNLIGENEVVFSALQTEADVEVRPSQTEIYALGDDRLNGKYRLQVKSTQAAKNSYIYTRDIDLGNVATAYAVGAKGLLEEYIAFIQITLREHGIDCDLTKKYDNQTKTAVTKFQRRHDARLVDGVVDSETKSLFCREVWKKMLQTDPNRFNAVIERVKGNNPKSVKYIQHSATVAEIWELKNTDLDFQKVTFTGTNDPLSLSDTIYVSVPEKFRDARLSDTKVVDVKIKVGNFAKAKSYKGIQIEEVRAIPFTASGSARSRIFF